MYSQNKTHISSALCKFCYGTKTKPSSCCCRCPLILFCFVCLVWCFTSQSTAMVLSGRSVHLTTRFSWASLTKRLTILSLVTDNNLFWISGREENGRKNYFMINFHESMGLGWDLTHDPWICSQRRYRLHYAVRLILLCSYNIYSCQESESEPDSSSCNTAVVSDCRSSKTDVRGSSVKNNEKAKL